MRSSGILLHITSLPGPDGIGSLGREAYSFIDFLCASGMKIWQVLPVGPTGYGESPYQSPSVFAGNPMMISIQKLVDDKLLEIAEEDRLSPPNEEQIDFSAVRASKEKALRLCFAQSREKCAGKVDEFAAANEWAEDYAFFMALKNHFNNVALSTWPDRSIRMREAAAMAKYRKELDNEIRYHLFVQWLFHIQWTELHAYANDKGIRLMGDMPIYCSEDSSDVWTHPEVFQLDKDRIMTHVAGVPPDYFSKTGQLWGNPLYDWDSLKKDGFTWWVKRMRNMRQMYDLVRIDHFIGFANYYSIKHGAADAIHGTWIDGPGAALFTKLTAMIPGMSIVAEDLGSVNEKVRSLLRTVAYPGMRVLSFAFDGQNEENEHLPQNYVKNSVVYTGTHDNDTVLGWLEKADKKSVRYAMEVLGFSRIADGPRAFMRGIMTSCADTAIIPMQDILELGSEARMNTPGTTGGNWQWRMKASAANEALAADLATLNCQTRRDL